jgi:hypothetical protein
MEMAFLLVKLYYFCFLDLLYTKPILSEKNSWNLAAARIPSRGSKTKSKHF